MKQRLPVEASSKHHFFEATKFWKTMCEEIHGMIWVSLNTMPVGLWGQRLEHPKPQVLNLEFPGLK